MEIKARFFIQKVLEKAINNGGINPGDAINLTRKEYCARMNYQGFCTDHCEDCLPELQRFIELADANSARGLYIYRLRDAVARKVDERLEKRENELRNTYREPSELSFADFYKNLLDQINSQIDDKSDEKG